MLMRPLLIILALSPLPTTPSRVEVPPVTPVRVVAPYRAPADAYAPGHRGIDLGARPGQLVVSPIAGTVAFRGMVAGRPVISVTEGRRIVSLEPVTSTLEPGTAVFAGQALGTVGPGGHCSLRCVHLGLRVDGRYVNPLVLHARLVP